MSIPKTNPPAFYRSKQLATNFFGANNPGQRMRSIPRYKFMYYATFVVNSDAQNLFPNLKDIGKYEQGISFMIKSIDKPKVDLQVQELNQYNRKRYAYTRLKYNPIQIRFHDTVDDRILQVWVNYFRYYFGDSRPKDSSVFDDSVVGKFNDSSGWGLRPVSEQINFFKRLELYALFGRKYTQINYINPRIGNVDWQNFDSEQPGSEEMSMTVDYESLEYAASGATITADLASQFGFAVDVHLEPPTQLGEITTADKNYITNTFRGTNTSSNFLPKNFPTAQFSGIANNSINNLFGVGSAFNSVVSKINNVIAAPSVFSHSVLGAFGAVNFGSISSDIKQVFTHPTVNSVGTLLNQVQLTTNQLASSTNQISYGFSQLSNTFSTPFYPQSSTQPAAEIGTISAATAATTLYGDGAYYEIPSDYGHEAQDYSSPDPYIDDIPDSDDTDQDFEQALKGPGQDLPDGSDDDLDRLGKTGNPQEDFDNDPTNLQDPVTDTRENPQIQNLNSFQVTSGSTTHRALVLDNYGNQISPGESISDSTSNTSTPITRT